MKVREQNCEAAEPFRFGLSRRVKKDMQKMPAKRKKTFLE